MKRTKLRPIYLISRTPVAICVALAFLLIIPARGDELQFPVPPHQYAYWKAPATKLPADVVAATHDLFMLGLADPRGCEYREISITVGDVWGHVSDIKTHGWVLPQGNFAIAWNGLLYPLKSSGERINLRDELFNLPFAIRQALPESQAVSCPPQSLVGVCLLLRLGESASAESLWRAARQSPLAKTNIKRAPPLEELSAQWAWAIWNRALCAHLRGDDAVALHDVRQLKHLQPQIEARVSAERLKAKNKTPFRLLFLAPLPGLLKDQERRARTETTSSSTDIAALINNLENVSARQWGQPGGVDLTTSPVVQEIIARDAEAVPALLQTMAQDYRLTRSVSFHRDYFTGRHLIPVAEAAYAALRQITGQSFGPAEDLAVGGAKRAALVKRARAQLQISLGNLAVTKMPAPHFSRASNFSDLAQQLRKTTHDLALKNQPLRDFTIFEPLWRYPNAAPLTQLAENLFNSKNALWNPLVDPRRAAQTKEQWSNAVAGPLLAVPAYRAQVARQLRNWARCGTAEILSGDKMLMRPPNAKIEESFNRDATTPPIGARNDFRVCDFYAWQLSKIQGAPRCELYWPFEKRDRAASDVSEWLQAYGALLHPALQNAATSTARLVFPAFKTPATPAAVKNHRAIFSLQGLGKTRVANLKLPMPAKWKNQTVTIWQAEEVAVDNQWRRHYGIVAPHEIRRVAASEIELLKAK